MAVAIARVTGADYVTGNQKVKVRDLTLSGNYATGGESLTAADVGLKKIFQVIPNGSGSSTDLATGNNFSYDYATAKLVVYESGASGAAIAEKTNGEAHATGLHVRCTFVGY